MLAAEAAAARAMKETASLKTMFDITELMCSQLDEDSTGVQIKAIGETVFIPLGRVTEALRTT